MPPRSAIIAGMSETLLAGVLGAGVSLVSVLLTLLVNSRTERARAAQEIARDREGRAFEHLVAAYVHFSNEMRDAELHAAQFEARHGHTYADAIDSSTGEPRPREDSAVEAALEALRLFADADLYGAAAEYRRAFYQMWWGPTAEERGSGDRLLSVYESQEAFVAAGKRALHLPA